MLADKYLWSINTDILNTSKNWNSYSKKFGFIKIMIFMSLWLSFKFYILSNHFSKVNIISRNENLHNYDVSSLWILN